MINFAKKSKHIQKTKLINNFYINYLILTFTVKKQIKTHKAMKIISYLTHYERTILNSLDLESYDINTDEMSEYDQIQEVYKIFLEEKGYHVKQVGEIKAFTDWLQGLPTVLTVPFYNYEILQNALMDGLDVSTEDKEDSFLTLYWGRLADAFFTLKDNL